MVRIELAPYDPGWPGRFGQEADRIRTALGPGALRVEHVGSTAVPGLAAKPVVDLLLLVADAAAEDTYVPALSAAGYLLTVREPDWFEHRMLTGPAEPANLHVFEQGCPEAYRMLRFRDRLRADEDDRRRYQRAKEELARESWPSVQRYAEAKTAVVRAILARDAAERG